ncbi:MAG: hypothetical protein LBF05_04015 [Tannerella sp.]|jgi:hypothetical protein|nr:hypothetical protein [Tannerella sp.]
MANSNNNFLLKNNEELYNQTTQYNVSYLVEHLAYGSIGVSDVDHEYVATSVHGLQNGVRGLEESD